MIADQKVISFVLVKHAQTAYTMPPPLKIGKNLHLFYIYSPSIFSASLYSLVQVGVYYDMVYYVYLLSIFRFTAPAISPGKAYFLSHPLFLVPSCFFFIPSSTPSSHLLLFIFAL